MVTTGRAHRGHDGDHAAETTTIYATSSTLEMHVTESKAGAEIESVKSKNSAMKGIMIIMVLTTTKLTGNDHRRQDTSQEASRHIP
jgi:hypothetical protein